MNTNLTLTAVLGIITIILGAFGAHALNEQLGVDDLKSFETAVRYQMYHVLILLFANTYSGFSNQVKKQISWLFFIGILFFSGSIYAITIGGIDAKTIWFITPLGGLLFISGWVVMLRSFLRKPNQENY